MEAEGSPYVGPRPFETADRPFFFGRDREARELEARVIAHPLLLLFAPSGAGKTSLLNARLIPELRDEGLQVLPATRVQRAYPEDEMPSRGANIFAFNAIRELQRLLAAGRGSRPSASRAADPEDAAKFTLASFLQDFPRERDEGGEPKPLLLIIDQFEELFTSHPDRWDERRGFLEQIQEALDRVPLLRVLLAMREDYLAHLETYRENFADRLRIRMRLELLRETAAILAVERPLEGKGRRFAPGVANKIVRELLQVRTRNERGETVTVPGEFVEPVQLQVVCQTLWENLPPDSEPTTVDEALLGSVGDVDQALGRFYDRVVQQAVQDTDLNEKDLRAWFEEKLITPGATRGIVNEQEEQTSKLLPPIEFMVTKHLVRSERRHGSRWFELSHDRFLKPVQDSNLAYEQARAALAQDPATRQRSLFRTMGNMSILASALGGFFPARESSLWITWLCLVFASVYGGFGVAHVVRHFRAGARPAIDGLSGLLLAGMAFSMGYLVYGAIVSASWWHLGVYTALLALYAVLGSRTGGGFLSLQ